MIDTTRGPVTERTYAFLRDGILRGRYSVGSVLAETVLAEEMGISRTPVRYSLSQLLHDGLAEIGPRRQLIVRGFTPERRAEILLLREQLETLSVARACERMSADQIDVLRLNLLRQRRAAGEGREDDFIDLDEEFHLGIASGADLPLLERFLRQLRGFVRLARLGAPRPPQVLVQVVAEHEEIVEAIESRDPETARAALVSHLERSDYVIAPPAATEAASR